MYAIERIKRYILDEFWLISLFLFSSFLFFVNIKMNIFRYDNFDMGKFDLGNMTQMVWYTMNGKFMYLTDYFGTNLPRWSMSHVDPILALFTPIFAIFPHPLTLVFSQIALVLYSSIVVYLISRLYFDSKFVGFLFGMAYLFNPSVGFLTAWTGFHGVTAVIPFFLLAFYVFERMYRNNRFTRKGLVLFWLFLVLTMMGKEQLPLYIFMFGLFVWFFRKMPRLGLSMAVVGVVWFAVAFFVIIPHYAPLRVEGYKKFAEEMDLDVGDTTNVTGDNYFLSRYEGFGSSYGEIAKNIVLQPELSVRVFFGGDKQENFERTIAPLGFTSILYPPFFAVAGIDFAINYLTTAGGIGTSEIVNHRISMILPVLFISTILFADYVLRIIDLYLPWLGNRKRYVLYVLVFWVFGWSVHTTFKYNNPVFQWFTQAATKRAPFVGKIFAFEEQENAVKMDIEIGEVFRIKPLDNRDRACAEKVVGMIPDKASVSGPDYMGSHLALRETYAIFPALFKEADYVIVDVFSQKILRILDLDVSLVRDVVSEIMQSEDYKLVTGCGNLFVYKKTDNSQRSKLLPIQERYSYDESFSHEIFASLHVVDFSMPSVVKRGDFVEGEITYSRKDEGSLSDFFLFTTFINIETQELYQVANLPSFSILRPGDWKRNYYYREKLDFVFPDYLDSGIYRIFVGMHNSIRNRSIYLGELELL